MQQTLTQTSPSEAPVVFVPRSGTQLTAQDVQAMRVRLRDLKNELQNAAERRNSVAGQLKDADISARPGYEARLQALDTRILGIENEITRVVQLMGTAPTGALVSETRESPDPARIAEQVVGDIVPIVAILSIFVFMPIMIAISRFIWRRSTPAPRAIQPDHATQQRLEQLQQSMDTIAIEVERISEGQRFVTKIMSERAIAAGGAEPLRSPMKAAIPVERG